MKPLSAILALAFLAGCTPEDRERFVTTAPLVADVYCAGDREAMPEATRLWCAARDTRPRPRPEGLVP